MITNNEEEKKIISHLKHYGFVTPNAEIYQGLAKSWDFGVNGAELKKKLKELWWRYFITSVPYNFGYETAILTHSKVLEASGHKKNFNDWIVECKKCNKKTRLDNLISEKKFMEFVLLPIERKDFFKIEEKCQCGGNEFSSPIQFNLMLKTDIYSSKNKSEDDCYVYLRPETCQGIFINFLSIKNNVNKKLPFGIGQIGKSFRNEVTLNHGIFRMREFEQAELEIFINKDKEKMWEFWEKRSWEFFKKIIINESLISKKIISQEELPHYALKTIDFQFKYKFGLGEVCSISDRGDYDLKNHSEKSSYFLGVKETEKDKNEIPHIVEVSFGIERLMLAILESSYCDEIVEKSKLKRKYLKINPLISPFFSSVMPLSKQLNQKSYDLYLNLIKTADFSISYEETGNIGNRYRRQDAIGTFFCITVDFETAKDNKVTIRERDSMEQKRVPIDKIKSHLNFKLSLFEKKFFN